MLWVFAAALLVRSIPSYRHVFDGEVSFAGNDPWFHMRTIRNLVENFPLRSQFDPYSAFPTGQPVTTGPVFDYTAAFVAWALGLGHPSPELVDAVGAWLPAVLGALVAVAVFVLGRTLFHPRVGLLGAALFATYPGLSFETSRLGFADHHVMEVLFATAALAFLCRALRTASTRPWRDVVLAGLLLGGLFCTRPAATFVVAVLVVWIGIQSAINHTRGATNDRVAAILSAALLIALLLFLPSRHLVWGHYAVVAIVLGAAIAIASALCSRLLDRLQAPRWSHLPAFAGVGLVALYAGALLWRAEALSLADAIATRAMATDQMVLELRPLLWMDGLFSLAPAWAEFTTSWFLAVPALAALGIHGWRRNDAALNLFVVWSAAMLALGVAQHRIILYAAPSVALLAACAAWWLVSRWRQTARAVGIACIAAWLLYPNVSLLLPAARADRTMPEDWRYALAWLRRETPEPMSSPGAYDAHYPALVSGEGFAYPSTAYGVMNWWEHGHWITAAGRRIPVSNGMQTGAATAARFFTSTDPAEMDALLAETGSRYVIADGRLLVPRAELLAQGNAGLLAMPALYGGRGEDYCRLLVETLPDGTRRLVVLFMPAYFQTALARMWLFDGEAVEAQEPTWAFSYRPGATVGPFRIGEITESRQFPTYQEAAAYRDARPEATIAIGGVNPTRTPVPLEALPRVRRVYWSLSDGGTGAVKIFAWDPP